MTDTQLSPQEYQRARNARLGAVGAKLLTDETHWRDRYHFFTARGYSLRARYHPDWTPSWESNPDADPMRAEDYYHSSQGHLIDATRTEDGRLVYIKKVRSNGEELKIATFFSQPHMREDPRNHCVPILDSFPDEEVANLSYIVMPFLRPTDSPPFESVAEVLNFADQIIEGLAFMHENYVAHRDCASTNLLMDAAPLFPQGFHPVIYTQTRDLATTAPFIPRTNASEPIKYYLTDFGLSVRILAGEPRQVLGKDGADQEVPELSEAVPYDPFKVDVFILGNALRQQLHDKYFRLDFLRPLILSMTKEKPEDRPSAEAVLSQWRAIRKHVTVFHRICRLRGRDEGVVTALIHDVLSLFKVSFLLARHLLRWTSDWITLILG